MRVELAVVLQEEVLSTGSVSSKSTYDAGRKEERVGRGESRKHGIAKTMPWAEEARALSAYKYYIGARAGPRWVRRLKGHASCFLARFVPGAMPDTRPSWPAETPRAQDEDVRGACSGPGHDRSCYKLPREAVV
ncbi:hypothetical protein MTO96_052281 [Rhipicephalus appendiculatus]